MAFSVLMVTADMITAQRRSSGIIIRFFPYLSLLTIFSNKSANSQHIHIENTKTHWTQ
jgi:hypothetical protein